MHFVRNESKGLFWKQEPLIIIMQVELLIKLLAPLTSAEKQKAFATLTVVHKINNKKIAELRFFYHTFQMKEKSRFN
jgi:hypothetical protein